MKKQAYRIQKDRINSKSASVVPLYETMKYDREGGTFFSF